MTKVALAVVLISLGFASSASAAYIICLDNSPNGGTISRAATNNKITVRAYFGESCTTYNPFEVYPTSTKGCWYLDNTDPWSVEATDICKITVTTDGNDWFWLDQVELKHGSGAPYWQWNSDDLIGYCLSTDSSDGSGNGHCLSNRSFGTWNFVP